MIIKKLLRTVGLFLASALPALSLCACAQGTPTEPTETKSAFETYWSDTYDGELGLTVKGSDMYLAGKKYNAVALNCYDLLTQTYATNKIDDAYRLLERLSEEKVPVIRFTVIGHGYKDYRIFFSAKERYMGFLEQILDKADKLHVGLIPSFFWLYNGLPDYLDAPIRSWNDENSETVKFAMSFTDELVTMMKDHKSVWGYEFGNEHNLACDLPEKHLPPLPENSSRTRSMEEDGFTMDDYNKILTVWGERVRAIDSGDRLLTSGNAIFRNVQYNLAENGKWDIDTAEQKKQITETMHPSPLNTVSEHLYHWDDGTDEYKITENGETVQQNFVEHVRLMSDICEELGQAYFVGEFGYDRFTVFETNERYMIFRKMAMAAVEEDIPLMLIWNFSLGVVETEVTFYPDDELTPLVFDLIREVNQMFEQNNSAAEK